MNDAVLVVISMNLLLLGPVVLVYYYPNYHLTTWTLVSFLGAGVTGTLLGRVFKYTSIEHIGASRTEPIIMSNALVASILGVIFLDETVVPFHWVAIACIVFGVAVVSWETTRSNPYDLSRRELAIGFVAPVLGAFSYGLEPVFVSAGLATGTPAPVGVVLKTVAALAGFVLYLGVKGDLPSAETLRSGNLRWFVLAGACNTLFVLGYYVALGIAPVSVIAPILPTSSLFTVLLSAAVMPRQLEHVTWKLGGAAAIVVVGVVGLAVYA